MNPVGPPAPALCQVRGSNTEKAHSGFPTIIYSRILASGWSGNCKLVTGRPDPTYQQVSFGSHNVKSFFFSLVISLKELEDFT